MARLSKRTEADIEKAMFMPEEMAARTLAAIQRCGNRNEQKAIFDILQLNPNIKRHLKMVNGCLVPKEG